MTYTRVQMDHFAAFYRANSRMPGPLSRDSADESVIPGVIAPPPTGEEMVYESSPAGSHPAGSHPAGSFPAGSFPAGSFPAGSYPALTGLEAMERPGAWAEAGGADAWRTAWLSRGTAGGAGAVEGVQTAPGFGSVFAATKCLPYATPGTCALHGAPILPDSLASSYNVSSVSPDLLGRPGRFERCGCGMKNTKPAY
jgi:hypothetical protein